MSADNIGYCPRCLKNSIGLLRDGEQPLDCNTENTLREYYDLGIESNGKFFVNYSCECRVCGFQFKFDYDLDLIRINPGEIKHNKFSKEATI